MSRNYTKRRKLSTRKQKLRKTYKGGRDTGVKGKMKRRVRRSSTCRLNGKCSLIV